MRQRRQGRNRSVVPERVFDDPEITPRIYQRNIETGGGQLALGLTTEELFGTGMDTPHLLRAKPFGSSGEAAAFLDFDKDDFFTLVEDKVNFTAPSAPASMRNGGSPVKIGTLDTVFGGYPRVIGHAAPVCPLHRYAHNCPFVSLRPS